MPPYMPYLVYGTVTSSGGSNSGEAEIDITTSLGTMQWTANSNGIYVADLADVGYSDGETVTISTKDKFNNEISTDTLTLSGGFSNLDISLSVRTKPQGTTGYTVKSMLQSIGNCPISSDNPLPTTDFSTLVPESYDYISLSYTGSNLTGVVYKEGGSSGKTVATLTLTYDGSDNLLTVTRS